MRIIAGRFKGLSLTNFSAKHIRPTTDRIKGSLFNKWQGEVEGARVLDLFAGTGNLGLEALSRGASFVTFVENSEVSVRIIRENIEKLKIAKSEYRIIKQEVVNFLKTSQDKPYDLILIDPPFTEKMAHDVLMAVGRSKVVGPNTLIAIEIGTKEKFEDQYGKVFCYDRRDFGDKSLALFRMREVGAQDTGDLGGEPQ